MPDSYTVLWDQGRCRDLQRRGEVGARLEVLFGGPHLSEPSFRLAGARPGDWVYPIHISGGVLFLLGRMRVGEILSLEEYVRRKPELFAGCHSETDATAVLRCWLAKHPEKRYLAPTCTDECVLGTDGTCIRFDVAVPSDVLEALRFRSKRAERGIRHIVDGRLKSAISLQGIYRLTEVSAAAIEQVYLEASSTSDAL